MKVNNKLYSSYGIILFFSVMIGFVGLSTFSNINEHLNFVEIHASPNTLRALEMRTAVFQVQQWLTDASATGWEDGFDEAKEWADIYYKNSDELKNDLKLIGEIDKLKNVEETDKLFDSYYVEGQKMARAYIDEGQESGNKHMLNFDVNAAAIGEKIDIVNEEIVADLTNSFIIINKHKKNFSIIIWSVLIIVLFLGVFLSIYMVKTITIPLLNLDFLSKKLAEGDLTVKIDNKMLLKKDEMGNLARSFEVMIKNISSMVKNIVVNANTMAATAEELSASSEESNASAEQVSATVQEIAKGGQILSSNANDTKLATESLISSINAVATSSQASSKKAMDAKDAALKGGESAKLAGDKMKSISFVVNTSSAQIQELGTKTQEINKIIEVINSISEQTNLLALNAAIEAARAGEAGKGFAVVADEVRKLAEQSQKATKQIEEMISDIIKSTKTSVEAMQKGTVEVEEGSKIVNEALNSLILIGEKIEGVAGDFEMISAATQEQIASSEKVKKSIQEVSSIAGESAASTEEVSASVEEITGTIQQVANSAQDLAKNSEELKRLVNKFKIDKV